MYGEQHPSRVALREARETTIDQLSESFARDELSLDEFEQRVDRAYAAANPEEVQALVSDLRVRPQRVEAMSNAQAVAPETAIVPMLARGKLGRKIDRRLGLAIFGNVERRGRFTLAADSEALAVFGNVELDLREAIIPEGVTELHVRAIFGNVEIIVPPTISVDCHGFGIFGNFEGLQRVPAADDGTPVLRITGKAIFGNVEISTRVRGPLGRVMSVAKSGFKDPESSALPPLTPRRLPPGK